MTRVVSRWVQGSSGFSSSDTPDTVPVGVLEHIGYDAINDMGRPAVTGAGCGRV